MRTLAAPVRGRNARVTWVRETFRVTVAVLSLPPILGVGLGQRAISSDLNCAQKRNNS
jgi:hypothetical protein